MTIAATDLGERARAERKRSASSRLALKAWGFMSPAMVLLLSIFNVAPTGTFNPGTFDANTGLVERLGIVLYSDYILPFELASVLLAGPAERAARLWHRRFFANSSSQKDHS